MAQEVGHGSYSGTPSAIGDNTTVRASGSTASRMLKDRFADIVNVKDFGAIGNAIADDTAAINAAIVYAGSFGNYSAVYFPSGEYHITSSLLLTETAGVSLVGAGNARITGNFNDFLIKRSATGLPPPPCSIESLYISNSADNTAAGAIKFGNRVVANIRNCYVKIIGGKAIELSDFPFQISIDNCNIVGYDPANRTNYGIYGGFAHVVGSKVQGFKYGVYLNNTGQGTSIDNCNLEVNVYAVYNEGCNFSTIKNCTFEANDTAIWAHNAPGFNVSSSSLYGTVNAPSGSSKWGLYIDGSSLVSVSSVSGHGAAYGDVYIGPNTGTQSSFFDCNFQKWIYSGANNPTMFGCNPSTDGTYSASDRFIVPVPLEVKSIQKHSEVTGQVIGKNVSGVGIAVGAAATSVSIVFPAYAAGGNDVAPNSTTPTTGGSLANGTYYYVATAVCDDCETGYNTVYPVTLAGANNAVAFTWNGYQMNAAGIGTFRRRVYRSSTDPASNGGVYDGYYDLTLNSNSPWTDTGAAFTGTKRVPPAVGTGSTSHIEPDGNYGIVVTPSWNASSWITAKATTGFTINFSAAPGGGGGTVDWILIR